MDNYGDFFRLIRFSFISDFSSERKKKNRVYYIKIIFNTFQVKYSLYILENYHDDNEF